MFSCAYEAAATVAQKLKNYSYNFLKNKNSLAPTIYET